MTRLAHAIDAERIEEAISMLQQYVDSDQLAPVFSVLRELPEHPGDQVLLARLSAVVNDLGVLQGAVLTYAPAIAGLLSDDPFAEDE